MTGQTDQQAGNVADYEVYQLLQQCLQQQQRQQILQQRHVLLILL